MIPENTVRKQINYCLNTRLWCPGINRWDVLHGWCSLGPRDSFLFIFPLDSEVACGSLSFVTQLESLTLFFTAIIRWIVDSRNQKLYSVEVKIFQWHVLLDLQGMIACWIGKFDLFCLCVYASEFDFSPLRAVRHIFLISDTSFVLSQNALQHCAVITVTLITDICQNVSRTVFKISLCLRCYIQLLSFPLHQQTWSHHLCCLAWLHKQSHTLYAGASGVASRYFNSLSSL